MSLEDAALTGLRAVAHPVRLRMLSLLTGAPLSAAELARELDITQANASYHVRMLAEAGQVEVESVESVNGGRAKKYRYRPPQRGSSRDRDRDRHQGRDDGQVEQRQYLEVLHQELVRRSAQRIDGPAISSDAEVWLTPETWCRARELVYEASRLVHEEALPPHTAGAEHVSFQAELFPMRDVRDEGGE